MTEPQKPRRGRPATGLTPKRNVRVPDAIWEAVEANAEAEGITPSDYLRRALERENARIERARKRAAKEQPSG